MRMKITVKQLRALIKECINESEESDARAREAKRRADDEMYGKPIEHNRAEENDDMTTCTKCGIPTPLNNVLENDYYCDECFDDKGFCQRCQGNGCTACNNRGCFKSPREQSEALSEPDPPSSRPLARRHH